MFPPAHTHYQTTVRGFGMRGDPEERAIILGRYIAENNTTVRAAAARYGVSKSTVHKDIQTRLQRLDPVLFRQAQQVLAVNKAQRHLRGGEATRRKYREQSL